MNRSMPPNNFYAIKDFKSHMTFLVRVFKSPKNFRIHCSTSCTLIIIIRLVQK